MEYTETRVSDYHVGDHEGADDRMTIPVLDLLNFESDVADGCEYVLTSPRSLQACAELGIKPVELLRVTFNELVGERPDLSVKEARDYLLEVNEARNDKLQLARVTRREIMNGTHEPGTRKRTSSGPTQPKKTKSETALQERLQPTRPISPSRSVSSPYVADPISLTPLGAGVLKSHSLPPSLLNSARKYSQKSSQKQHERLVNSLMKKFSDRRAEIKKARNTWLRWEEEKQRIRFEKIKEQKSIQARVARSRKDFESCINMTERRTNDEIIRDMAEKEAKIKEKMRKAEMNAHQVKREKEARIRENMEMEKRKKANQAERLRQHERAKNLKEQETVIKLDKRLSEAEKLRKIKLLQDAENVQRRNHQTRKNFEETYNECQIRQTELNKKKEMELIQRLKQAKQNNETLMKQRSTAIRVAADRKQKQIEEVQQAKDILLREQRDRIEQEIRRNEVLAEEARRGADRAKLKKLGEAKERHVHERQRAVQNIERSKVEFENDKLKLENTISTKLRKTAQIQKEREKTILISKMRAKHEGVKRDIIRHELESFDEKVRRAQLFSTHIDRPNQII